MDRRAWLTQTLALGCLLGPLMAATGLIAQHPAVRVIVDNDFAGDPDGLFALAHQWLSPSARTALVTTSALDAELARLAGIEAPCPVVAGAEQFGTGDAQLSAAAHAIVAEALRDDPLPLFLCCGGPLTNVAAALRLAPRIATRMTLVWIGGALTAGGEPEYNQATDAEAARQVLSHPTLPLWVVPRETYRQLAVSVAELSAELRPISPLARWLYERYLHLPPFVRLGPQVTLGDSALVQAVVLNRQPPVRRVALLPGGRELPVVDRADPRALMVDLLAQLKLNADPGRRSA